MGRECVITIGRIGTCALMATLNAPGKNLFNGYLELFRVPSGKIKMEMPSRSVLTIVMRLACLDSAFVLSTGIAMRLIR